MLRWPLVQIIGTIVVLLLVSFLPVPVLSVIIEPVRLLLVMVLGVACGYLGLILRDRTPEAQSVVVEQCERTR